MSSSDPSYLCKQDPADYISRGGMFANSGKSLSSWLSSEVGLEVGEGPG